MKQSTFMCLLLLLLGSTSFVQSQDPIKISFAYVFSERLAHYGYGAKQGAELAMEEINAVGGLDGRRLVGIYSDTKLKPDVGFEVVTKMIQQERELRGFSDVICFTANRYNVLRSTRSELEQALEILNS